MLQLPARSPIPIGQVGDDPPATADGEEALAVATGDWDEGVQHGLPVLRCRSRGLVVDDHQLICHDLLHATEEIAHLAEAL
eukprot:6857787-Heterocapsa_arctica.AAC.1